MRLLVMASLKNKTPGAGECLGVMARFEMPAHIRAHCRAVATVALFLARELNVGVFGELDLNLVVAAALLHDITKRYSFDNSLDHALTGAKLVKRLGYGPVAPLVRQHVVLSATRPAGRVSEVELVNYADKRVVGDEVVSVGQRFEYIRGRYARREGDVERIEAAGARVLGLEGLIFRFLGFGPGRLLGLNRWRGLGWPMGLG